MKKFRFYFNGMEENEYVGTIVNEELEKIEKENESDFNHYFPSQKLYGYSKKELWESAKDYAQNYGDVVSISCNGRIWTNAEVKLDKPSEMKHAESSPIRVSRHDGLIFFEIAGGYKLEDEDFHRSGFSVYHQNYNTAKEMFWSEWKEMHPGYWLDARISK